MENGVVINFHCIEKMHHDGAPYKPPNRPQARRGVLDSNSIGRRNVSPAPAAANVRTIGPYEGKIAGLYDLEETLGRGHFAVVKLARHVFTGEKVAVKVIDKTKLDDVSKAHLFQEVRCMKLVQHPNVVRLYEVIDTATKLYLIMELGDGGDLYDYIMRHESGLSERWAKDYFRQIVCAISYCHQLHVVHRDLKPENVVFCQKAGTTVKLTDFGFSNKFCPGQKLETSCGSLAYSAPEILLGDSYDAPAVDIWSLGVILYMLVCGRPPFQEANDSETLTMIMDCKYETPVHVSPECYDLISQMLIKNPEKRATLHQIETHDWLRGELSPSTNNISNKSSTDVILPLVSREHLSDDDHNLIVQKIVNGNIATKDEIQDCLDRNSYNHITATYYLLAERKLRAKRQESNHRLRLLRPNNLPLVQSEGLPSVNVESAPTASETNNNAGAVQLKQLQLLAVPKTSIGDLPQRTRKCSIVQEADEEDEDLASPIAVGRDDLVPALNRRGSRSEGRLNFAIQATLARAPLPPTTTILTDSATITLPIIGGGAAQNQCVKPYKTLPSPADNSNNEPSHPLAVLMEAAPKFSSGRSGRKAARTTSTTYSSSEDASEDDAAGAGVTPVKKLSSGRRDSYDDSSDSQDRGGTATGGGNSSTSTTCNNVTTNQQQQQQQNTSSHHHHQKKQDGYRKRNTHTSPPISSTVTSQTANNSARLRESQSLNRISEVQEEVLGPAVQTRPLQLLTNENRCSLLNNRSIRQRIIHGLTIGSRKQHENLTTKNQVSTVGKQHCSRKDGGTYRLLNDENVNKVTSTNSNSNNIVVCEKSGLKKMKLLTKYFQMHRKFCNIPLPALFARSRLYKAQSCSSIQRDEIVEKKDTVEKSSENCVILRRKCSKQQCRAVTLHDKDFALINDKTEQNRILQLKSTAIVENSSFC